MNSAVHAWIDELDRLGKERNDAWQISREEGLLLHQIALATRARLVVEVGTSYGFSGLFWGAAMQRNDGHLHTIDRDPKKYDSSKLTFAEAGLNTVITNHLGNAAQVLAKLDGPFDIVFLDADKASTQAYIDLVWPKLRVGGSLIIDNATTHRDELAPIIEQLRGREDVQSAEVAVGNGIEWAIKTQPRA